LRRRLSLVVVGFSSSSPTTLGVLTACLLAPDAGQLQNAHARSHAQTQQHPICRQAAKTRHKMLARAAVASRVSAAAAASASAPLLLRRGAAALAPAPAAAARRPLSALGTVAAASPPSPASMQLQRRALASMSMGAPGGGGGGGYPFLHNGGSERSPSATATTPLPKA